MSSPRIYGVRHHGPGCARSLALALAETPPDILLVEGPPEADGLASLVAHEQMQPPVALLVYALDDTSQASFYPFARFSPEWQALHYAASNNIPLRFFDLPASIRLAQREADASETEIDATQQEAGVLALSQGDPMDEYARLAGFADGESWWDALIEQRQHSSELFSVVLDAMRALRAKTASAQSASPVQATRQLWEDRREAAMRQQIRAAQKEGFQNIAIVCGAWHAPALENLPPAKHDAALLKDLPKCKVAATWVPWNYQRLSFTSGYGAGIASPGWYDFLWQQKHSEGDSFAQLDERWLTHVAHLLRQQDLVASSAEVIDAVRLARMLAQLNGRGQPGLEEFNQAASSALCMGEAAPLALIRKEMIIGERLGQVPDETPAAPIARDLAQEQKRLRLKPSALDQELALDLRNENDLARSHLLHRLSMLQVPWGKQQQVHGKRGSFHEAWRLLWQPEFAVSLIEAGRFGQTVASAAQGRCLEVINKAQHLPELTQCLQQALLAQLPEIVHALLQKLADVAAQSADILHLLDALPPLTSALRYGSVRQIERGQIAGIVSVMLARIAIGLPNACLHIKNDAAQEIVRRLDALNLAIATEQDASFSATWTDCLRTISQLQGAHPLLLGRAHRLLLDLQILESTQLAQSLGLALTHPSPEYSADWVEGLLAGSGVLLVHDEQLWALLDNWLRQLQGEEFRRVLPLLRRAFSHFTPGERQMLAQKSAQTGTAQVELTLDAGHANSIVPLARALLGMLP